MDIGKIENLTRVLQASISPVALISGVGLLILSFSNRFARVTDRLRELARLRSGSPAAAGRMERQIGIFLRRARILRLSISHAVGCVLLLSCLVLSLFAIAVADVRLNLLVLVLFALSLLCLIISLGLFLWDMHLSLEAVHEELHQREARTEPTR